MLIVQEQQLSEIRKEYLDDFTKRMQLSIMENLSLNVNAVPYSKVEAAINEAQKFRFELEADIEQYIYLKWKYKAFNQAPLPAKVLSILTYPDREVETMIDELIALFEGLSDC